MHQKTWEKRKKGSICASLFAGRPSITDSSPQSAIPFGKFHLLKRIGVGGMAELFLAKDAEREELVAVKRILPFFAQEPEVVRLFLDEALIAAQLHHPNIVQIYELGKLDESLFISMEYVEGVDAHKLLHEELKQGIALPYGVAVYIMSQVCGGLHYAHTATGVKGTLLGVIHRDVSPQNVMVSFDGDVKLVDFGIAKAGLRAERTKPGVIKGKFLYLSPEQLSQERLDHRADLFALGTMMYELTTGKGPFQRATTEAVVYAIKAEEPLPPERVRPDYPAELSRIVMKCLMKDRNQRYQTASEVKRDLDSYLKVTRPVDAADLSGYVARLFGMQAPGMAKSPEMDSLQSWPVEVESAKDEVSVSWLRRLKTVTQSVLARIGSGSRVSNFRAFDFLEQGARLTSEAARARRVQESRTKNILAALQYIRSVEQCLYKRLEMAFNKQAREELVKFRRSVKRRQDHALDDFLASRKLPSLRTIASWLAPSTELQPPEFKDRLRRALALQANGSEILYILGSVRNVLSHQAEYEQEGQPLKQADRFLDIRVLESGQRAIDIAPHKLRELELICKNILDRTPD